MTRTKRSAAPMRPASPGAGSLDLRGSPGAVLALQEAERYMAQGRHADAEQQLRRALTAGSTSPRVHVLLAVIAVGHNEPARALEHARVASVLAPRDPQVQLLLGRAHKLLGELPQAVQAYRRAIELQPRLADAHVSLGIALKAQGDLDAAIDCYRRALVIDPQLAVAHANLGNALATRATSASSNEDDGAAEALIAAQVRAVSAEPGNAELHRNHGAALMQARRHLEACEAFNRALTLDQSDATSCLSLTMCLQALEQHELASEAVRKWLSLNPGNVALMRQLAESLTRIGSVDEALECALEALAIDPDPSIRLHVANALLHARRQEEALVHCREAIDALGQPAERYALLLMAMTYVNEDPDQVFAAHAEFGQRALPLAGPRPPWRPLAPGERLRIGYVSADFVRHSVSYFMEPLLEQHDRSLFEVVCYHNNARSDAVTERLKALGHRWVECHGMSDERLCARIASDRIDVLIDLTGLTANSRILAFAVGPAPLQLSYLGYPTVTGVTTLDYRITDAVIDPGDLPALDSELPLALARTMFCYRPPELAPPVAPLPAARAGHVTFGSFNNVAKLSDRTIALWSAVLRAVPGSRLLLKGKSATQASVRANLERALAAQGVEADRLELRAAVADDAGHLGLYGSVDIALDTFPYNGATTTCEALWMGVPVVTLRGRTHTARMGASILAALDHDDWVAIDDEGFVIKAAMLARDLDRLTEVRAGLRDRMRASPLMDAPGFAREFEAAVLRAWVLRGQSLMS